MFSYRHIYHAGNYADVFKHVILIALIEQLQRKESGFCIHDTHAGLGLYDLTAEQAAKNKEYHSGVFKLLNAKELPALLQTYCDIVRDCNENSSIHFYPGSPLIARKLMRVQDTMVLTELNKADHGQLKNGFKGDLQVAVHFQDAWKGMNAFLPPKLKRGLVLIDPPYELKSESDDLIKALQAAYKKWPGGIYAIWYPVFEENFDIRLGRKLKDTGIHKILNCKMTVKDGSDGRRMIGTGMFIINPPWQLVDKLEPVLKSLWQLLSQNQMGECAINWLVPETQSDR